MRFRCELSQAHYGKNNDRTPNSLFSAQPTASEIDKVHHQQASNNGIMDGLMESLDELRNRVKSDASKHSPNGQGGPPLVLFVEEQNGSQQDKNQHYGEEDGHQLASCEKRTIKVFHTR